MKLANIGTWIKADSDTPNVFDGDQILVAVPVMCKSGARQHVSHDENAQWFWEYSVLTITCDENYLGLLCNGEMFGWDWCDVEYYQKLS